MTLILSFVCRSVAVQVADRLISKRRGQSLRAIDEIANKLVIYRARDAIVSIGYAGQAYIGNIPTDEWIAQLLSGETTARAPGEMGGIRLGRTKNNWDIGFAIRRIRDELPAHIADGQVVQVCVAGHQIGRRGFVRPIVCEMTLRPNAVTHFYQSPRLWGPGLCSIGSIGVEIGDDERRRVLLHLRDAKPPRTHDEIAEFLTATIRKQSHPGVGPHTSAVIIPFPGSAPVRSKFLPLTPHSAVLRTPDTERHLTIDYAPWIIGPDLIKPPTIEIGGSNYGVAGIEVTVEGRAPTSGILSLMQTVPRRHP